MNSLLMLFAQKFHLLVRSNRNINATFVDKTKYMLSGIPDDISEMGYSLQIDFSEIGLKPKWESQNLFV